MTTGGQPAVRMNDRHSFPVGGLVEFAWTYAYRHKGIMKVDRRGLLKAISVGVALAPVQSSRSIRRSRQKAIPAGRRPAQVPSSFRWTRT